MACECPVDIYVLFKDTLVGGAAMFAVVAAFNGLKTWKTQLKGTVEYDLTRRLLRATYRLRDAYSVVRNPMMWANEFVPVPEDFKGTTVEARHYGYAAAYEKRWNRLSEARRELDAELLEAEVIWDRTVHDRFQRLFELQGELFAYLHAYLKTQNPKECDSMRESYTNRLKGKRDALFEATGEEDTFGKDIAAAIESIEEWLKPHLRK